ncbi:MAG TPA: hypothetical protein VK215_01570 [Acidimicrobiales bacterium]|nr:hypothetical protein [Acidimicrobiales bacterium]
MSKSRQLRSSLLLALGPVAVLAGACSSSPTTPVATVVVARGGVTCHNITGSLTFSPSLTTKGGAAETTSITVNAAGCGTSGSNVSRVIKGVGTATLTSTSNSCAGLLNSRPLTIDIAWTPATVHPSIVTFTGYGGASGPSGGEGFTLPKSGATAKVTGSFAGSDHGAGSTATAFSGQTTTQLLTACESSAGLTSIAVTSGSVTLK